MLLRSQNGWPASADRAVVNIQTISVPVRAGTLKIPLRAEAAPALVAMLQWWDANIEPITLGSGLGTWGYNYRVIRGGTSLSNHASGTAIDINAPKHPLGARGTVPADRVAAIRAKAASLGLRWGGDYSSRPDEMHFEVNTAPPASVVQYSEAKAAGQSVAEAVQYSTALTVGAGREGRALARRAGAALTRNWWIAAGTVAAAGLLLVVVVVRRRRRG